MGRPVQLKSPLPPPLARPSPPSSGVVLCQCPLKPTVFLPPPGVDLLDGEGHQIDGVHFVDMEGVESRRVVWRETLALPCGRRLMVPWEMPLPVVLNGPLSLADPDWVEVAP